MKEKLPFVSVIIPTYNRKNLLKNCLISVLNQDYKNFEVIIVDDGSNDGTNKLIYDFKKIYNNIKYFNQKNAGPGAARNNGIKNAKGSIIAFTDDDCLVQKDWIKNALINFKDTSVAGVEGLTFTKKNNTSPLSILTYTYDGAGFMTCNMFYRRQVLLGVNGFDTNFKKAFREDTDLGWRILDRGYKILFDREVKVEHLVLKYNLKNFIKKHIRLNELFWDVLLLKKHPRRFRSSNEVLFRIINMHSIFHYIFFSTLLMSLSLILLFKSFIINLVSLILIIIAYIVTVFLHTRMKSGISLIHLLKYKSEFMQLILFWWIILIYDFFIKIYAIIKFRKFLI